MSVRLPTGYCNTASHWEGYLVARANMGSRDDSSDDQHRQHQAGIAKPLPAFISKTWLMVSSGDHHDIISWNVVGDGFVVKREHDFAQFILPRYGCASPRLVNHVADHTRSCRYFKHKNFSSFVRQLNLYGFHKFAHDLNIEFKHHAFLRGREDLLPRIKRKHALPKSLAAPAGGNNQTMSRSKHIVDELQSQVDNLKTQYQQMWKVQQQMMLFLAAFLRDYSPTPSLPAPSSDVIPAKASIANVHAGKRRRIANIIVDGDADGHAVDPQTAQFVVSRLNEFSANGNQLSVEQKRMLVGRPGVQIQEQAIKGLAKMTTLQKQVAQPQAAPRTDPPPAQEAEPAITAGNSNSSAVAATKGFLVSPGSSQSIWGCPPLNLNASGDSLTFFPMMPASPPTQAHDDNVRDLLLGSSMTRAFTLSNPLDNLGEPFG